MGFSRIAGIAALGFAIVIVLANAIMVPAGLPLTGAEIGEVNAFFGTEGDIVAIAGVENPLVVYARKDTPPGLKIAADIMKASDFKALSLNAQNSNTVNQSLSLDILGLKYQAIPAYRGLKEVETAILQNIGQVANSSLSGWSGSVEPTMGTRRESSGTI